MIITERLEVNITRHCTNRCASCNHASPVAEPYCMDPEVLRRDLDKLKTMLHTGFICLQGGEPLLHPQMETLLDVIGRAGVADHLGILSNGQLLPTMPESFWEKCRQWHIELRVSLYPNLDQGMLSRMTAKAQAYQFEIRPSPVPRFVQVLANRPDGASFNGCPWRQCPAVHEGYYYMCALAPFWPGLFLGLAQNPDGIALEGITEPALRHYLDRKTPFASCVRCTGAQATWIDWHQCDTKEQWLAESTYVP